MLGKTDPRAGKPRIEQCSQTQASFQTGRKIPDCSSGPVGIGLPERQDLAVCQLWMIGEVDPLDSEDRPALQPVAKVVRLRGLVKPCGIDEQVVIRTGQSGRRNDLAVI